METIVMTKDELIEKVKVYRYMDMPYIRIIDIPNPYRSEFVSDSYGSTCPLIPEEGECHYSWDWEKWLRIRFRESYKLRFPKQYKYISDEECSAEYFWRKINVKNQTNNDIKYNISMCEDYVSIKFKDTFVVLENNKVKHSIMTFERMMEVDKILQNAIDNLKEAKYSIIKCGLKKESDYNVE